MATKLGSFLRGLQEKYDRDDEKPGFQIVPKARRIQREQLRENRRQPGSLLRSFKPISQQQLESVPKRFRIPATIASNVGGTFTSGVRDVGQAYQRRSQPLVAGTQALRGIGKIAISPTPLFAGLSLASSVGKPTSITRRASTGLVRGLSQTKLPTLTQEKYNPFGADDKFFGMSTDNKVGRYIKDLKIDPVMAAGEMVGFVNNPVNKRLFKLTEKVLPSRGNAYKWLATTGIRGSLEQFILDLPDRADNLTEVEKVNWLARKAVEGAVQEVGGRLIFGAIGRGMQNVMDSKAAARAFDELVEAKRKLNTPTTTFRDGKKVTIPMWKQSLDDLGQKFPIGLTTKNIGDDIRARLDVFKQRGQMDDAQLTKNFKKEFMTWGKGQFGDDFDAGKWGKIYDEVVPRIGIEQFAQRFEANKGMMGETEGGLKLMRAIRDVKPGGERVPFPTDVDAPPAFRISHDMPDGTRMVGPEHPGAVPGSTRIVEEPKVGVKPKLENIVIDEAAFRELPDRKMQLDYTKNTQANLHKVVDSINTKVNKSGVKMEDFINDIETGGNKYPELTKLHNRLMARLAEYVGEIDPDFQPRDMYYPHMRKGVDGPNTMEQIAEGIWIAGADKDLGNFMRRQDKMTSYDMDYSNVMKRYMDQFVTKKYVNQLKGETPLQESVLDYSRQVADAVRNDASVDDIKTPDFIAEGQKTEQKLKKVSFKLGALGEQARTNDNIMKNIGGDLNNAWRKYRDVRTPTKPGEVGAYFKNLNKALQGFVEEAGKHEFAEPRTQMYVNKMIKDMTTKASLEKTLYDQAGQIFLDVTSMAHLGLSAKTGILQVMELSKLPAIFKPGELAGGVKNFDPKRLDADYSVRDFDNPYDLRREELGLTNKAYDKFKDVLFKPIEKGERFKNLVYAAVAEEAGKKRGLEGDELRSFVRDVLFRYGNVSSKNNRAQVYGHTTGRLLLQYGQYNLKNAQEIVDRVSYGNLARKSGLSKKMWEQYGKALGLTTSQVANAVAIGMFVGLPIKFIAQQLIPIGFGPIVTIAQRLMENEFGPGSEESKKQKRLRILQQNFQPAGTQTVRIREGLGASKGFDETATGRVRYYGDEFTPAQKLKAAIFGKYSVKPVRDYYGEDRRAFGENQSKIFLSEDKEGRKKYAESVLSDREQNALIKKAKESFNTGEDLEGVEKASFTMDGVDYDGYIVGNKFVYQNEDGESKSKSLEAVEKKIRKDEKSLLNSEYSLAVDRFKRENNYEGYIDVTEKYIDYLKDYKKKLDTKKDAKERVDVQNKIEDLEANLKKYKGYGGFKKGSSSGRSSKGRKISVKTANVPTTKIKLPSTYVQLKKPKVIKAPNIDMPELDMDGLEKLLGDLSTDITKPLPIQKKFG